MATLSKQRSLELLKEQGALYWDVERPWNPYTKKRLDLFNLFDIISINIGVPGITGYQCCGSDSSDHVKKVLEGFVDGSGKKIEPNKFMAPWLRAGNTALIWSWRKRCYEKQDGHRSKAKEWVLFQIEFVLKDSQVVAQEIPHDNEP